MKHTFLYIVTALVLLACNTHKDEKEPDINPNKCTQYACPIHPDKTSATLENCPVCNTPMVLVRDSLKKDSLKHSLK